MITEAIILPGGLDGRPAAGDSPACLADAGGKPLLEHRIRQLLAQGIRRFIVPVGERERMVEAFLRQVFPSLDFVILLDDEADKPGHSLRYAMAYAGAGQVLVLGGDMPYRIDLNGIGARHAASATECTAVLVAPDAEATGDNDGFYLIDRTRFLARAEEETMDFPAGYVARCRAANTLDEIRISGSSMDGQARELEARGIDNTWTLFLDRDGVININIPNDYVRHWDEFVFEPGAKEAIASLSGLFGRIVVITNQRGVGKGWMTRATLDDLHARMVAEIEAAGGRIDAIFACTSPEDRDYDRKPNPGMAFRARQQFPEIDFSRSIMCGDKGIDMQWARNIGAFGMWILPGSDDLERSGAHRRFPSLAVFARWILREI